MHQLLVCSTCVRAHAVVGVFSDLPRGVVRPGCVSATYCATSVPEQGLNVIGMRLIYNSLG